MTVKLVNLLKRKESRKIIMVGNVLSLFIYKPFKCAGVDNDRFIGKKISAVAVTAVNNTAEEEDFAEREAVYEKYRPELQYQIRSEKIFNLSKIFIFSSSETQVRM